MTRKSLSYPYKPVKEFNDFQFNYFPFKSEKQRFHFIPVYTENRYEDCNDNEISRTIVLDNAKVENFKSVLMNNNAHIQQLTSDVSTEPIDDVVKTFS